MIAGVATGMADAFGIDVVVMRVIWVIVTIASGGMGVVAYAICWLAFPSDQNPAPLTEFRQRNHRHNAGFIVGLALLALGLVIVFGQAAPPFRHGGSIVWATILIGGGLAVLLLRHPDRDGDEPDRTPPIAPTEAHDVSAADVRGADVPGTPEAPTNEIAAASAGYLPPPPTSAWTQAAPWPEPPTPRVRRPRRTPFLTPLTISLMLIGAGAAALLDSTGALHLTVAGVLASALVLVGGALIVSAWFGRARGLIPIGFLLLLATIPAATIDVPITGGIGERRYQPTTRAALQRNYELGIGHLVVDLRDAALLDHITAISASVGIGELEVLVPADMRIVVRAHAGVGETDLFGRQDDGWPQNTRRAAGDGEGGVLHLDLEVGAGSVRVQRWNSDGSLELLPFRQGVN
jgi:phage shock protein PspC (stress-responsive transcriptional regulator)